MMNKKITKIISEIREIEKRNAHHIMEAQVEMFNEYHDKVMEFIAELNQLSDDHKKQYVTFLEEIASVLQNWQKFWDQKMINLRDAILDISLNAEKHRKYIDANFVSQENGK